MYNKLNVERSTQSLIALLKQKIETARINRDTTTLLFYSTFLGDIEKANKAANNKATLDELVVTVGAQWRKAMESNMVIASQKNLPLLEEQMKKELGLLEEILPKMFTKEELEDIIKDYLAVKPEAPFDREGQVSECKSIQLGEVMKYLKTNYNGQYDGKLASQIMMKLWGLMN